MKEVTGRIIIATFSSQVERIIHFIDIAKKYGKFNEDDSGIWAGYTSAKDNDIKDIGVKCANCALYEGGSSCSIISAKVEPSGYCRFAIIPDGVVKKR